MIPVTVNDVIPEDVASRLPVVVLLDDASQRFLPIWMRTFEAENVAVHLREVKVARPLTHTLAANLLEAVDATLEEVRIESIKNDTFYAVAKVRHGESVREVDARPSDAINLALRTGSPIYVAEDVMEKVGVAIPEGQTLERYKLINDSWKKSVDKRVRSSKPPAELSEDEKLQVKEKHNQELLAFMFEGSET